MTSQGSDTALTVVVDDIRHGARSRRSQVPQVGVDRGESTSQLLLVLPVLMLVLSIGVQAAVHAHAAHVATAAASHGAAVGSTPTGSVSSASRAAHRMAVDLGASLVVAPRTAISGGMVEVTVEVSVPRLVPFVPRSVTRRMTEPQERLSREWER